MSKVKLCTLIPIAVVVLMGLSPAAAPSPSDTPLRGTVKSSEGKPLEGVAVSARADGKTFTTTVYTDRNAIYYFPPLEDGQYKVWAQAVGFEAGRSAIKLTTGNAVEQNLMLKPLQDFSKQLSGVEWMASLPEDTPQDRRVKRLLGINCQICHPMGFVMQNRFDATGWAAILNFMEKANHLGVIARDNRIDPFIHGYKEDIVGYLTRVRGPGSASLTYKPLPRATGEAAQIVVTEYDISPGHLPGYSLVENGSDWSMGTPSRWESRATHDAVVDQQGYVWFGDPVTPKRTIGKLDPRTGLVTDYTLLAENNKPVGAHDIIVDQMGSIWFNNEPEGTLDKFDPKTEKFQHFPRPDSLPPVGSGLIAVDSKGNVWDCVWAKAIPKLDPKLGIQYAAASSQQPGGAIKLDPKTGEYTFYRAITPVLRPYGVAIDAEDNAWFTQPGLDRLGTVDGRTGKVGEVILSPMDRDDVEYTAQDKEIASKFQADAQYGPPWQKGPRRQGADKNGNTLWVGLAMANRLAKIDIHTKKITEYAMPYHYSWPYGVGVDKNHMVWVTAMNADRIFKFNPFTEQFTAYPLPTLGTDGRFVSVDNSTDPPTVWIPYYGTSKLARIQFRTAGVTRSASR